MSYFNHAFNKVFLGTGATRGGVPSITDPATTDGFIITSGVHSVVLAGPNLGPGYFGFFNKDTYLSVALGDLAGAGCCPLVLASAALKSNDKQGPFHGGYQESNKSKYINPKLISKYYRVDQCTPQQHIVHIGDTNYTGSAAGAVETLNFASITDGGAVYTASTTFTGIATTADAAGIGLLVDVVTDGTGAITAVTVTPGQGGSGYDCVAPEVITIAGDLLGATTPADDVTIEVSTCATAGNANCTIPFYCGETYYLRLEIKGSPALRFANHNLYQTLDAYAGCCTDATPAEIDSTLIFIQWAQAIVETPMFVDFIQVVVFDETGKPWFATADLAVAAGWLATDIWSLYVSPGHTVGMSGGMRLLGAYVDTVFSNCTFAVTDHYEKEPIRISASLVDLNGDPCTFEGLCVVEECPPLQGMGFGEQVVRDLIMSEAYLQNFFASNDKRIQEITQGDQILGSVVRGQMYTRYYIQHTVPRFNNPSSTFDNDQYLLEIICNGTMAAFEAFMTAWLDGCGNGCTSLETFACTPCTPIDVPRPIV